jgi:superfamily II DNA or RNA helicase
MDGWRRQGFGLWGRHDAAPWLTPREGAMKARDYQERCCNAILDGAARGLRAMLCVLFTGAGKTVIFSLLARMCSTSRILVIAPMRELVWQAADTADRVTGEMAEVEMGRAWSMDGRVVIASRQTLLSGREKRYKRLLGVRFVIVDEAHTQYSEPVLRMLREFQEHGAIVLGFTATPFRMDGARLLNFYEETVFDYGLQAGIDDGWCVPPLAKIVRCTDLDLSKVGISGGDYSAQDLETVLGASRQLHQFCLTIQRERVGSSIAFLPGVRSARALAEMAERQYGMRAAWICGNEWMQPEDERNRIINLYKKGEIDVLCNCQIATMGFDAPLTQTIFMFRPTKSRVLAMQVWGRATRPLPGVVDGDLLLSTPAARKAAIAESAKPNFRIIDITDSTSHHSIVTAVDMFAKDVAPEVVQRARQLAEEGDAEDPGDLLAQAAEDVRKAKLIEEGLRAQRGQANGHLHSEEVQIGRKKDISEYKVPLRGRYQGKTMGEVPDDYIEWALRQPSIKGWQRAYFSRERTRRRAVIRHG